MLFLLPSSFPSKKAVFIHTVGPFVNKKQRKANHGLMVLGSTFFGMGDVSSISNVLDMYL